MATCHQCCTASSPSSTVCMNPQHCAGGAGMRPGISPVAVGRWCSGGRVCARMQQLGSERGSDSFWSGRSGSDSSLWSAQLARRARAGRQGCADCACVIWRASAMLPFPRRSHRARSQTVVVDRGQERVRVRREPAAAPEKPPPLRGAQPNTTRIEQRHGLAWLRARRRPVAAVSKPRRERRTGTPCIVALARQAL